MNTISITAFKSEPIKAVLFVLFHNTCLMIWKTFFGRHILNQHCLSFVEYEKLLEFLKGIIHPNMKMHSLSTHYYADGVLA